MNPKNLSIKNFYYDLPDEKIAKYPLEERDSSKLLIYKNGIINESKYKNLVAEIPEDSLLIFNNTKVVEARIVFQKESRSTIEIFCLEPDEKYNDITTAMLQKGAVLWKCLVGGAKKWKEELITKTINETLTLTAKKIEKRNDYFLIELNWNDDLLSFAEVLHLAGKIPLPPYLNRDVEEKDKATYQTIYAKHDGSVAAPTAGLHFTENVLHSLKQKHIEADYLTLHVGAGTFKPVKADTMEEHEMHSEFIDVSIQLIEKIISKLDDTIIAVGTTSLRTIESLYWLGVKLIQSSQKNEHKAIEISQWDCYELPQNIEPKIALESLLNWMQKNNLERLLTKTQIIIAPGYKLKIADAIVTNFHQPKSTLLLLVSAVIGDDWKKVYDYALDNNFRFLSYGDGSLLWSNPK
jgi:S-adenosylmethionine:tRNA ribosyltransferase-isomerase